MGRCPGGCAGKQQRGPALSSARGPTAPACRKTSAAQGANSQPAQLSPNESNPKRSEPTGCSPWVAVRSAGADGKKKDPCLSASEFGVLPRPCRAPQRTLRAAQGAAVGSPFLPPFLGETQKGGRLSGRNPDAASRSESSPAKSTRPDQHLTSAFQRDKKGSRPSVRNPDTASRSGSNQPTAHRRFVLQIHPNPSRPSPQAAAAMPAAGANNASTPCSSRHRRQFAIRASASCTSCTGQPPR